MRRTEERFHLPPPFSGESYAFGTWVGDPLRLRLSSPRTGSQGEHLEMNAPRNLLEQHQLGISELDGVSITVSIGTKLDEG